MTVHQLQVGDGEAKPGSVVIERLGGGDRFRVRCGTLDAEVTATLAADGTGRMLIGGRTMEFRAVRTASGVEVWHDGRRYRFESADRPPRRTGAIAAHGPTGQLLAPMPGTVLKIQVAEGDVFDAHQPLIILESMKMEMTLSAPHAGRVKALHCAVGQLVPMGAVLADLDTGERA